MNKRIFGKTLFGILPLTCLLLLAACAPSRQAPAESKAPLLVYPEPPDEPRFFYERTLHGSADVVPEDEDAGLRQLLTGVKPASGDFLNKPHGVSIFRGRVFVSDSAQRHVAVFDIPGRRFYRIGEDGPGRLVMPMGLDVDRAGNLYVADITARQVVVFDKDGKFLRRIGGEQWLVRPASVTVDPQGDRMYVVDVGGVKSEIHRIRVFNPINGTHLFDFGSRGTGPGEFNFPYDLAVGKAGNLFVVDSANFRIQIFDRDGKYLRSFGELGRRMDNFARPRGICTDADGNVYVVDAAHGNFKIFDAEGRLLMFIGDPSEQDKPASFPLPSDVNVDEDGRVYVVDQWHRKVDVFRPARLKADQGWFASKKPPAPPAK